ncbi:hypothetical protein DM01DRAFT_321307 [Hesseltinella vesiculosa]|uniref:Uncharacterized protein n=1 Tax=Hesseltinella vesiculosa TaxID=101127 RepID=A0A1X2GWP7_9FUNG|nr:hypothetical protein DM01DRAFT_321307 [Hesseltinella vesiculosa]
MLTTSTYSCSNTWDTDALTEKKRPIGQLWKRMSKLFHRISTLSPPSILTNTSRASTTSGTSTSLDNEEMWTPPPFDSEPSSPYPSDHRYHPHSCYSHASYLPQSSLYTFNGGPSQPSPQPHPTNKNKRLRKSSQWEPPVQQPNKLVIPPYSPTYCQPNNFPYSNFYIKLPDGRYMLRYRDGNRNHLRTDIIDAQYI